MNPTGDSSIKSDSSSNTLTTGSNNQQTHVDQKSVKEGHSYSTNPPTTDKNIERTEGVFTDSALKTDPFYDQKSLDIKGLSELSDDVNIEDMFGEEISQIDQDTNDIKKLTTESDSDSDKARKVLETKHESLIKIDDMDKSIAEDSAVIGSTLDSALEDKGQKEEFLQKIDSFIATTINNNNIETADYTTNSDDFVDNMVEDAFKRGQLTITGSDGVKRPMTMEEKDKFKKNLKEQVATLLHHHGELRTLKEFAREQALQQQAHHGEVPGGPHHTARIKLPAPRPINRALERLDLFGKLKNPTSSELRAIQKMLQEEWALKIIEQKAEEFKKEIQHEQKEATIEHKIEDRENLAKEILAASVKLSSIRKKVEEKSGKDDFTQMTTAFDEFDRFLKVLIRKSTVARVVS